MSHPLIDQCTGPMPCFKDFLRQAILEGRKTQTRRVIKDAPEECSIAVGWYHPTVIDRHGEEQPGTRTFGAYTADGEWGCPCPYGQPGDLRYLREPLVKCETASGGAVALYADDDQSVRDAARLEVDWRWQRDRLPQIHMPRIYVRTVCRITGIRVERVQDITEADAIAEGASDADEYAGITYANYRTGFRYLWDSINAKRGYAWADNPMVWVEEFEVVK